MMNITKRIFALLLTVAVLICTLAACNGKNEPENTTPDPTIEVTTPDQDTPVVSPTEKKITSVNITCGKSAIENFAAAEMKWYFEKKNVTLSPDGYGITLTIDESIPRDGYRITAAENGLVLAANNSRGMAYGLYGFLEKFLGVHFYSADTVVIDKGDVMIGTGLLMEVAPAFEVLRNPWYPIEKLAEKDGGNTHTDADLTKSFTIGAVASHLDSETVCLTNSKNQTRSIAYVEDFLSKNPHVTTIIITPNIGAENYCTCEDCAKINTEENSPAGTFVRFVNMLAQKFDEKYPDVHFEIAVRDYLLKAPSLTKTAEGISVRFSTADCHISHPLNDASCPVSLQFAESIRSWGAICEGVSVDYVLTATKDFIPVFANLGTLRENMRFFAESGVSSITCSGNFVCPTGEFGELRVYLISQLMQNPYMTEEEYDTYIDTFLKDFYGEGWMYIRKFIDLTIELAADGHQTADGSPFDAITKEEYEQYAATIEDWWDKAETLADNFFDNRADFVKRARFQWRYIKLCLHPNAEDAQALITDAASNPRVGWREKQWNVDVANSDLSKAPSEWKYKS